MDILLLSFNISFALIRDLNEIELVKGENRLFYAQLDNEMVLYRKIRNDLFQGFIKEIFLFYRLQSKNLAYCLGYAKINDEYLLIFPQNPFTLQDYFNNKFKGKIVKKNLIDDQYRKVLRNVFEIFQFLFNKKLYLDNCTLYDFFFTDQESVQLYNLSTVQDNEPIAHFRTLSQIFSTLIGDTIDVTTFPQGFQDIEKIMIS